MIVSINDLANELVTLVKNVADYSNQSFYVFNIMDAEEIAKLAMPPFAGIAYEGGYFVDNSGDPVATTAIRGVGLYKCSFTVIIGVSYEGAVSATEDTKKSATDLLDSTREAVVGYRGVNKRPWRLAGEMPLDSELEGVIFYGQMWETEIPVTSNHSN